MSTPKDIQNSQEPIHSETAPEMNAEAASEAVDRKETTKQRERKAEKRSNLLYISIAVIFLIAVVATFAWRSGIVQKSATAVTIDGEKYSSSEVSFYYQNAYLNFLNNFSYLISYIGLDTSAPLDEQIVNETAAAMLGIEAGSSWKEYFLDQAFVQMSTIQTVLRMAEAEGYVYPESVQLQYDDATASLKAAADASGISTDAYLQSNFGLDIGEKVYNAQLLRMLHYEAYANEYYENLPVSDSEIDAAYAASPVSYDLVSCEYIAINGSADPTTDADGNTVAATEEESAAALEEARNAANDMLAAYRDGAKLQALADTNLDASYTEDPAMAYSGSALSEWLFHDARKRGDVSVLESGSMVYVAVFHDRYLDESPTIDVRHILVPLEAGTLTSADEGYEAEQAQLKADAKARADELLAQWKAGEATEDSFAALAAQESADGSKYNGGLYTNVYQGQMVVTFNDWCFDSSRKPGDTDVVETEYGAHVMYFVAENLPIWKAQVVSELKGTEFSEWVDSLSASCDIERQSFGMGFVG